MAFTTSAHQILNAREASLPPAEIPEEFWNLVDRYRGDLMNQAYAVVHNMEDAEEVVQETFCEAFRQPGLLSKAASLGALLRTINRGNALNRLRTRQRIARKEIRRIPEARQATTGGFSLLELREAVAKAIEGLPEDLREPIVLHYWEHLNYDQIASRLKRSPRTVRRQLHDAYLALHERLKQYLQAGPAEALNRSIS